MDFSFMETIGNNKFSLKIYKLTGTSPCDKHNPPAIYYFLDEGKFCIGRPPSLPAGMILTINIQGLTHPKNYENKLYPIWPSIMLQLLEILEVVKQDSDLLELETMTLALYSSSCNCCTEKDAGDCINFNDAKKAYAVVQSWKRSPQRIKGSFSQYAPTGLSRHRFLHIINQLYNCSAAQLIYDINMQKAMNLLLSSNESIIMVSERSGYTNKENFITAFRNTYGVTPGYLRKQFGRQA